MRATPPTIAHVVLDALPDQGHWSEDEYLWLTDRATHPIEFTDGTLEVLPMPTDEHQGIIFSLAEALKAFIRPRGGIVRFSPLRLRLAGGRFREPDILVMLDRHDPRRANRYWTGADLVMEIVSPDNPERDLVKKRREYAATGIPEYWIVNPNDGTITVLILAGRAYTEHGIFGPGAIASSALLAGFAVAMDDVFATE